MKLRYFLRGLNYETSVGCYSTYHYNTLGINFPTKRKDLNLALTFSIENENVTSTIISLPTETISMYDTPNGVVLKVHPTNLITIKKDNWIGILLPSILIPSVISLKVNDIVTVEWDGSDYDLELEAYCKQSQSEDFSQPFKKTYTVKTSNGMFTILTRDI